MLKADHQRLEALFQDLLSAFAANAREELRAAWSELDASLTAHMALEERLILPAFAKADPAEAAALIDEHDVLRKRLLELGICVDLNVMRTELGSAFITDLRAHARREESLLYRWAAQHLDPDRDAGLLDRLRWLFASPEGRHRALGALRDLGILSPPAPERRAGAVLEPPHRYVCVECGGASDFDSPALSKPGVAEAVRHLGSVVGARLEVRGTCLKCQGRAAAAIPPPRAAASGGLP